MENDLGGGGGSSSSSEPYYGPPYDPDGEGSYGIEFQTIEQLNNQLQAEQPATARAIGWSWTFFAAFSLIPTAEAIRHSLERLTSDGADGWESPAARGVYEGKVNISASHLDRMVDASDQIGRALRDLATIMEEGQEEMQELYSEYTETMSAWDRAYTEDLMNLPSAEGIGTEIARQIPFVNQHVNRRTWFIEKESRVGWANPPDSLGMPNRGRFVAKWDAEARQIAQDIASRYETVTSRLDTVWVSKGVEFNFRPHPGGLGQPIPDLPVGPPGAGVPPPGGGAPPPLPAAAAPAPAPPPPALATAPVPPTVGVANLLNPANLVPPPGSGGAPAPPPGAIGPPVAPPGTTPGTVPAVQPPAPVPPPAPVGGLGANNVVNPPLGGVRPPAAPRGLTQFSPGSLFDPNNPAPPGVNLSQLSGPGGPGTGVLPPGTSGVDGPPGSQAGLPPGGMPPGMPPGMRMPPGGMAPPRPPQGAGRRGGQGAGPPGVGQPVAGPPGTVAGVPPGTDQAMPPGMGMPPGAGMPPGGPPGLRGQRDRPGVAPPGGGTPAAGVPEAFLPPPTSFAPPVLGDPKQRRARPGGASEAPRLARGAGGGGPGGTPPVLSNRHRTGSRLTYTQQREADRLARKERVKRFREMLKSTLAQDLPEGTSPVLDGRLGTTGGSATTPAVEVPAALRGLRRRTAADPHARPVPPADRASRRLVTEPAPAAQEPATAAWEVETPGGPVLSGDQPATTPRPAPRALGGNG